MVARARSEPEKNCIAKSAHLFVGRMDYRRKQQGRKNRLENKGLRIRQTQAFKSTRKPVVQQRFTVAKGPDGTNGFYLRSRKLNARAREFVPLK